MENLQENVEIFLKNASDEEKEVFENFLSALQNRQVEKKSTYLNYVLNWEKNYINDHTLEITIPLTPLTRNVHNMVHGGITATLIDTTLGTLAANQYPNDTGVVTTEIKVNYIAPGIGPNLRCVSNLVHKGKHLCVTEGKVYDHKDNLVAIGTGTFFTIKRKQ